MKDVLIGGKSILTHGWKLRIGKMILLRACYHVMLPFPEQWWWSCLVGRVVENFQNAYAKS